MARDRNNMIWRSYDGRDTLIKDLSVRHLVNILNHVRESNSKRTNPPYDPGICQILATEATIRVMAGFASNKGIPHQLNDGSWVVINQTDEEKRIADAETKRHQEMMADMVVRGLNKAI